MEEEEEEEEEQEEEEPQVEAEDEEMGDMIAHSDDDGESEGGEESQDGSEDIDWEEELRAKEAQLRGLCRDEDEELHPDDEEVRSRHATHRDAAHRLTLRHTAAGHPLHYVAAQHGDRRQGAHTATLPHSPPLRPPVHARRR